MMKNNKYYHSTVNIKEYEFEKVYIENIDKELINNIRSFNKIKDVNEKIKIVNKIPLEFPKCRICGNIIINSNFTIRCNIKDKYIQIISPEIYYREIDSIKYYLSCCEKCLLEHFKDDAPKSSKYYFMKANKYGQYSYGYSYDEYKKICSMITGVTEKSMIRKWGETEGKKKWKEYCDKQSLTNTYEYKKKVYGWNKQDFKNFNKSRAVTKENLINKYGEELGLKYFDDYVSKQKYTKSKEYMINKFGLEKTNQINQSKALTLENYIKRLGKEKGTKAYLEYINHSVNFYSNMSQELFKKLDEYLTPKYTTYYATKNGEYGVMLNDKKYIKLDYFILELNLCIEFNGTYYHGDPRIFKENDHPNPHNKTITAKEIWKNDNNRYKLLKESRNIDTIIIWENDYNDKNFNIEDFIKNTLHITI